MFFRTVHKYIEKCLKDGIKPRSLFAKWSLFYNTQNVHLDEMVFDLLCWSHSDKYVKSKMKKQ